MSISKTQKIIDFDKVGGPVYVGRPQGEKARTVFNLDDLDRESGRVIVRISEETYSVNSSFFLGLFSKSAKHFGSKELFLEKYIFECPEHIKESINLFVERSLRDKKPILI